MSGEVTLWDEPTEATKPWVVKIHAGWRRSLDEILAVGELLLAAERELPKGEFGPMVEQQLPFSGTTASKLKTIALCFSTWKTDRLPNRSPVC